MLNACSTTLEKRWDGGELALNTLSPSAHTRPQQAQTPVPLSWKMKETANALCYALSQDTTNGRN